MHDVSLGFSPDPGKEALDKGSISIRSSLTAFDLFSL